MPDQEITAADRRFVHSVHKFMLCGSVEVNHDVPAPDTIKFFLERKRFVHQIELPIRDFLFELVGNGITIWYFFEIFVEYRRRYSFESGGNINAADCRFQCLFGNVCRKQSAVPIFVICSKYSKSVMMSV